MRESACDIAGGVFRGVGTTCTACTNFADFLMPCNDDSDCSDGDPCTADVCDAVTHTCESEYRGYRYLGPDVRLTFDPYTSSHPFMIWTGSSLGMLWTDGMADRCDRTEEVCNTSAYFKTLDPLGNELGPAVRVSAPGDPIHMCAGGGGWLAGGSWTGSEFGLNWSCVDYPPYTPSEARYFHYFQRASADGRLLGDPVRVASGAGSGPWTVAWTGSEFVLPWSTETSTHIDRVGSAGSLVGSRYLPVDGSCLSLAWTGSELGLLYFSLIGTYTAYGDYRVARLDPLGMRTVELTTLESATWMDSSITWTGSSYMVGWSWTPETPIEDMYWLRQQRITVIDPGGAVLADTPLDDVAGYTHSRLPIWTGSELVVPWSTHPDMHRAEPGVSIITRLGPDGARTASDVVFDDEYEPENLTPVVWTGSEFIATGWSYVDDQEIIMNRFVFCE